MEGVKTYRIMMDPEKMGIKTSIAKISKEGAEIIWKAYSDQFGDSQTMDGREDRGGIVWLSELNAWIRRGLLPNDFDWTKYQIQ